MALLQVDNFTVSFSTRAGWVNAVEGASFEIEPGETVGLVGESGSGKTVTALAVLGLIRGQGGRVTGHAYFEGRDLRGSPNASWPTSAGARVSMIFQQPIRS